MFFSGLFSTNIPYIILAAVYSVSLGVYSVYYINNKIFNRNLPEKEIKLSEKSEINSGDYNFKDYARHEQVFDNFNSSAIPPHLKLKQVLLPEKPIFTHLINKRSQNPGFKLFSRPPPVFFTPYSSLNLC